MLFQPERTNVLPFIPKKNNLTQNKVSNSLLIEQKNKIFSPGKFGFAKEKNMIRNLQKQFKDEDKLFITLHPNLTRRVSNILDEKETNIFFYQTHKKRTYNNKFRVLSNKGKKNKTYNSTDEHFKTYTNTNTNTNSNYYGNSTRSQISSSIDNDNSIVPKYYKPLKSYNGKFMKEKIYNYKQFKIKMNREDPWNYHYNQKSNAF